MTPGRDAARPHGPRLLGIGVAVEVVGVALLVWQEQNIFTVNGAITLPAWGAMLFGVVLVARGYADLLRSTRPDARRLAAIAGAATGAVVLAVSLTWQLAAGLTPSGDLNLEVYAAFALFFVGAAGVTTGVGALARWGAAGEAGVAPSSLKPAAARTVGLIPSVSVLAAGVAFLSYAGLAAGGLDVRAAEVNSLYQLVALELCAGGAWLLLSGASGLFLLVPDARLREARRVADVAGALLLVAGAVTWWRTAPLVYALGEILLGGFLLSGTGLFLATRTGLARQVGRRSADPDLPPGPRTGSDGPREW